MSHTENLKKQAAALQAKMEAQAAKQKAKLDAIQGRIRVAEEREAIVQRWRERCMVEDVKKLIQRHQKNGLRADYQLVKGGAILVDAKAEAPAEAAPKKRTEWQKWALDTVQPILKACDRYYDTNLFSVAARLREGGHMSRVLYEGGVLEKATVEEAVAATHAEREARVAEAQAENSRRWRERLASGAV